MICLRSGYCCINYDVMIVDDPVKGLVENNVVHKKTGDRCKHLMGNKPGSHSCAVHDEPWYKDTPCAAFTQIECGNQQCRLGEHIIRLNENDHENIS